MLPTSLLALTASFIAPILAAPSCTTTSNGYAAQKMVYLFNDFCEQLTESNFATKQKYYDMPVVALGFTAGSVGDCSLKECLTSFGSLVDTCEKDDQSIFGTGNVATSCGTYSFEIQDTSVTTSLGAPDATITAATMKTYDVATLTSSSSSSSSTSSSSPSSYKASTTSEAQLESTYAPSTHVYFNATTSSRVASNSSTGYSSATLTAASSASLVSASTTATKPEVGTATLGTSGANVMQVSGLSLAIVAGVFGLFL
ncbi:hypothetical protein IFR04_001199 [Cadophora malorum]|uniref:Uncharacterized protein n=1 Tax=Cadophora malorum TaxID=108018 RepID=A0A8H8BVU1_9HELO|nr:hypothetical protein IFR04_001199 [Cadophora malorum]